MIIANLDGQYRIFEIYERVLYGNVNDCLLSEVIMFNRELCRGVEPLIINLPID